MRILIQNVDRASCTIDNKIVGEISRGFCVFVGFTHNDTKDRVERMVNKLVSLRLFDDENGKTNLSLNDVSGSILSISQFTLYASLKEGRRPSFVYALTPHLAEPLYDYFNKLIEQKYGKLSTGIFGADMLVSSVNDGPFTLILDSKELFQ